MIIKTRKFINKFCTCRVADEFLIPQYIFHNGRALLIMWCKTCKKESNGWAPILRLVEDDIRKCALSELITGKSLGFSEYNNIRQGRFCYRTDGVVTDSKKAISPRGYNNLITYLVASKVFVEKNPTKDTLHRYGTNYPNDSIRYSGNNVLGNHYTYNKRKYVPRNLTPYILKVNM
jgi:hypothetical protein